MNNPTVMLARPAVTPVQRQVLLVEDKPAFEQLLRRVIARLSPEWQVQCCRTGAAALRVLNRAPAAFDLILVDLKLPDMSGIKPIQAAALRFPQVPILAVSVLADKEAVRVAARAGARGVYMLEDHTERPMTRALSEVLAVNPSNSPSLTRPLLPFGGSPGSPPEGAHNARARRQRTARTRGRVELSPKQLALLQELARGQTYASAAEVMRVKLSTVQAHVRRLYRKLGATSKVQAILRAREQGLM